METPRFHLLFCGNLYVAPVLYVAGQKGAFFIHFCSLSLYLYLGASPSEPFAFRQFPSDLCVCVCAVVVGDERLNAIFGFRLILSQSWVLYRHQFIFLAQSYYHNVLIQYYNFFVLHSRSSLPHRRIRFVSFFRSCLCGMVWMWTTFLAILLRLR